MEKYQKEFMDMIESIPKGGEIKFNSWARKPPRIYVEKEDTVYWYMGAGVWEPQKKIKDAPTGE